MTKTKKEFKEKLANIEHQRWADWQKWCHKVLRENCPSPELEKVLERWDKQIATDYKDLTEKEKDSDREQVERYWPLIDRALQAREKEMKGIVEESNPVFFISTDEAGQAMDDAIHETKAQIYEDLFGREEKL